MDIDTLVLVVGWKEEKCTIWKTYLKAKKTAYKDYGFCKTEDPAV
jgi:hypothetical protein